MANKIWLSSVLHDSANNRTYFFTLQGVMTNLNADNSAVEDILRGLASLVQDVFPP